MFFTHFPAVSSSSVPRGHWQPTTHWSVQNTGPGSAQVGGQAVPHSVNTWPLMGHVLAVDLEVSNHEPNNVSFKLYIVSVCSCTYSTQLYRSHTSQPAHPVVSLGGTDSLGHTAGCRRWARGCYRWVGRLFHTLCTPALQWDRFPLHVCRL